MVRTASDKGVSPHFSVCTFAHLSMTHSRRVHSLDVFFLILTKLISNGKSGSDPIIGNLHAVILIALCRTRVDFIVKGWFYKLALSDCEAIFVDNVFANEGV